MKIFNLWWVFVFVVLFVSCTKNDNPQEPNLPAYADTSVIGRLQVKWQLISITHLEQNGPGRFQYIGTPMDYMIFAKDSIYTYVQGTHIDIKFKLLPDSSAFVFFRRSVPPKSTDTFHISKLTNHLLVFNGFTSSGDIGIDSLKR